MFRSEMRPPEIDTGEQRNTRSVPAYIAQCVTNRRRYWFCGGAERRPLSRPRPSPYIDKGRATVRLTQSRIEMVQILKIQIGRNLWTEVQISP